MAAAVLAVAPPFTDGVMSTILRAAEVRVAKALAPSSDPSATRAALIEEAAAAAVARLCTPIRADVSLGTPAAEISIATPTADAPDEQGCELVIDY